MMHVKEKLTKMLMYKQGKLIPLELLLNFLVVWKTLQVMYEKPRPSTITYFIEMYLTKYIDFPINFISKRNYVRVEKREYAKQKKTQKT